MPEKNEINMNICLICRAPIKSYSPVNNSDVHLYDCHRCGKYIIGPVSETIFQNRLYENPPNIPQIAKISSWLRNHQGIKITDERIERVLKLKTPSIGERASILLRCIADDFPKPGQEVNLNLSKVRSLLQNVYDYKSGIALSDFDSRALKYLATSWSEDCNELEFLLYDYLYKTKNYFVLLETQSWQISPAGWEFLDSIHTNKLNSNTVFLAMRFDERIMNFSETYIETAIRQAGYNPIRVDKYPQFNLIDDEMLSLIRQSKFIVSDFTENNSGVYYESGFARGLDLDVICICEKSFFEEKEEGVHFDTNHYPFLLWEYNKGEEFSKLLQYRIEASMGKGSFVV